jgi:DNA-binding NtrC family response regulator
MATAFMHRPVEDEDIASRSDAPLLISARTRRDVEELARRIHEGGSRASRPFVPIRIQAWPTMPRTIKKRWSAAFTTAAGGSVLLTGVEDMSPAFQDLFAELIDDLRRSNRPDSPRLISGTTVPLLDRVEAGTFSERLFYRLNLIHLVMGGVLAGRHLPTAPAVR